ncbi:bifunctional oligoribonuclease/PAP phosphatase NrnA [Fundidesulfovibrio butyratiphilus]
MASPMHDILRVLTSEDRFLVTSHASPDGDAAGSMAAMAHLLTALGKSFHLYNCTGMPEQYDWLPLPAPVETTIPEGGYDWIVTLDCGDQRRAGPALEAAMQGAKVLVIDHHIDNTRWGAFNWVEPELSSTGEMVGMLAEAAGVPLAGHLGEAVYLCLVSDTGSFSYGNTGPECMEMAARIIRLGMRPGRVNALIENQWTTARIRLFGEVLTSARQYYDGRLGVIRITLEQLARLGAGKADTEGLINYVLRIRGTKVALLLREDQGRMVKISLRSLEGVDIQPVAAAFGGGGHKSASGASFSGTLDESEVQLVEALSKVLEA